MSTKKAPGSTSMEEGQDGGRRRWPECEAGGKNPEETGGREAREKEHAKGRKGKEAWRRGWRKRTLASSGRRPDVGGAKTPKDALERGNTSHRLNRRLQTRQGGCRRRGRARRAGRGAESEGGRATRGTPRGGGGVAETRVPTYSHCGATPSSPSFSKRRHIPHRALSSHGRRASQRGAFPRRLGWERAAQGPGGRTGGDVSSRGTAYSNTWGWKAWCKGASSLPLLPRFSPPPLLSSGVITRMAAADLSQSYKQKKAAKSKRRERERERGGREWGPKSSEIFSSALMSTVGRSDAPEGRRS